MDEPRGAIIMGGVSKFRSAEVGVTSGAQTAISEALMGLPFVLILPEILQRHFNGDWGDVCAEDAQANEDALRFGARILSVYHVGMNPDAPNDQKIKLYVITEWDRSMTTVLLPEEY